MLALGSQPSKFLQRLYPTMEHFGTFQQAVVVLALPRVEAFSVPIIQQLTTMKSLYFLWESLQTLGLNGLNGWIVLIVGRG